MLTIRSHVSKSQYLDTKRAYIFTYTCSKRGLQLNRRLSKREIGVLCFCNGTAQGPGGRGRKLCFPNLSESLSRSWRGLLIFVALFWLLSVVLHQSTTSYYFWSWRQHNYGSHASLANPPPPFYLSVSLSLSHTHKYYPIPSQHRNTVCFHTRTTPTHFEPMLLVIDYYMCPTRISHSHESDLPICNNLPKLFWINFGDLRIIW